MHGNIKSWLAAAAVSSVLAADGAAQAAQPSPAVDTVVVSIEGARAMAVDANPEIRASSWRPIAARGDVRAARTLAFNPDVTFEARSPGAGFASRYEAAVGLELEVAGQRGLRAAASEAGYRATSRRFEDDGRRVLRGVEHAYHRLVAAERRQALVEQISALNTRLADAVAVQLREGEVSVLEANLARIEAARARALALEAGSERSSASLELASLLGLGGDVPVRTRGPATEAGDVTEAEVPSRVQRALTARPDLLAQQDDVERARQDARLAGRAAFPNLSVAALATREEPSSDPRFGVAVGIELPLFNRSQGLAARRRAELAEAEEARRATSLRVRLEVEDAVRAYASARRQVGLLEAEMLGPIRENQGLLETAFREGKIDLASLLLLRNQLLDAELSYWSAWERRERARTDLAAATGEILDGVDLSEGGAT